MKIKWMVLSAAAVMAGVQLRADTVVFSDNFNTENGGVGFLNYGTPLQDGTGGAGTFNTSFANWTVTGGTVDIIPIPVNNGKDGFPGPYTLLPTSYGLYVDLDGTTGQNGTLTSKGLSLAAGSYKLFFDMAGSQRSQDGTATISVKTGVASENLTLLSASPMTTYELDFTLASAQVVNLQFQDTSNPGNDDIGPLLDNIVLDAVGIPDNGTTVILLGLGLIGVALAQRKFAKI